MQNDGDYEAAEVIREKADRLHGSGGIIALIAIAFAIAHAMWATPWLLSLTIVLSAWAVAALLLQQVSVAQVQALVNTKRLSILEGKIDRLLESNRQARTDRYQDDAAF